MWWWGEVSWLLWWFAGGCGGIVGDDTDGRELRGERDGDGG